MDINQVKRVVPRQKDKHVETIIKKANRFYENARKSKSRQVLLQDISKSPELTALHKETLETLNKLLEPFIKQGHANYVSEQIKQELSSTNTTAENLFQSIQTFLSAPEIEHELQYYEANQVWGAKQSSDQIRSILDTITETAISNSSDSTANQMLEKIENIRELIHNRQDRMHVLNSYVALSYQRNEAVLSQLQAMLQAAVNADTALLNSPEFSQMYHKTIINLFNKPVYKSMIEKAYPNIIKCYSKLPTKLPANNDMNADTLVKLNEFVETWRNTADDITKKYQARHQRKAKLLEEVLTIRASPTVDGLVSNIHSKVSDFYLDPDHSLAANNKYDLKREGGLRHRISDLLGDNKATEDQFRERIAGLLDQLVASRLVQSHIIFDDYMTTTNNLEKQLDQICHMIRIKNAEDLSKSKDIGFVLSPPQQPDSTSIINNATNLEDCYSKHWADLFHACNTVYKAWKLVAFLKNDGKDPLIHKNIQNHENLRIQLDGLIQGLVHEYHEKYNTADRVQIRRTLGFLGVRIFEDQKVMAEYEDILTSMKQKSQKSQKTKTQTSTPNAEDPLIDADNMELSPVSNTLITEALRKIYYSTLGDLSLTEMQNDYVLQTYTKYLKTFVAKTPSLLTYRSEPWYKYRHSVLSAQAFQQLVKSEGITKDMLQDGQVIQTESPSGRPFYEYILLAFKNNRKYHHVYIHPDDYLPSTFSKRVFSDKIFKRHMSLFKCGLVAFLALSIIGIATFYLAGDFFTNLPITYPLGTKIVCGTLTFTVINGFLATFLGYIVMTMSNLQKRNHIHSTKVFIGITILSLMALMPMNIYQLFQLLGSLSLLCVYFFGMVRIGKDLLGKKKNSIDAETKNKTAALDLRRSSLERFNKNPRTIHLLQTLLFIVCCILALLALYLAYSTIMKVLGYVPATALAKDPTSEMDYLAYYTEYYKAKFQSSATSQSANPPQI
ncbi:hypothetical protein NEHOM01_1726 [Nematocida homosporus]|uniref:uncharacterized protein n=1 Tax=Nematocida homosporus TaxID=1912981 RepID=UPI00221EAB1D|nr:uncharacterized protein NEHOM01_1726 [Nematocida homosporus]KAI5186825.1 hypothetical protein NEHOM01_1726 [Nematocida homosporus]